MPVHVHIVCGRFLTMMAELSDFNRDCRVPSLKYLYWPYRKSLQPLIQTSIIPNNKAFSIYYRVHSAFPKRELLMMPWVKSVLQTVSVRQSTLRGATLPVQEATIFLSHTSSSIHFQVNYPGIRIAVIADITVPVTRAED